MLTEEQYKQLQSVEHFDLKTSSWVKYQKIYANRVVQFFVIIAMDEFLFITMVRNLIMRLVVFVVD